MAIEKLVAGSKVVPSEKHTAQILRVCGLEPGEVCNISEVEIVPKRTILPREYIDVGYVPSGYEPYLSKGLRTTNHDLMGADRFFHIKGRVFSAAWFRAATAAEVNRIARKSL